MLIKFLRSLDLSNKNNLVYNQQNTIILCCVWILICKTI
ncbi:hypothetical protein LX97_00471 [Nonlabens dokdonensis]|uniref:Uncharacterized protein n=1 Tax=Nonlabens dokdonensis TaxID=328515 RepID=A0ABX5Q0I7_9FLAO|nr:hypothetical protein LX97_00471 [Nonlabens dokdonensis]